MELRKKMKNDNCLMRDLKDGCDGCDDTTKECYEPWPEEKAILMSIKPEFVTKILTRTKTFEFKKKVWKNKEICKVYMYASLPIGQVLGYFIVRKVLKGTPEALWQHCQDSAGISKRKFFQYYKGRELGYAIAIKSVYMFETGQKPQIFPEFKKAPQNFMYIQNHKKSIKITKCEA